MCAHISLERCSLPNETYSLPIHSLHRGLSSHVDIHPPILSPCPATDQPHKTAPHSCIPPTHRVSAGSLVEKIFGHVRSRFVLFPAGSLFAFASREYARGHFRALGVRSWTNSSSSPGSRDLAPPNHSQSSGSRDSVWRENIWLETRKLQQPVALHCSEGGVCS